MVFNNIILDYRDPSVPPECPHLCQKTFYKRPHRYQAPALIRPARSLASEAGTCPQPAPLVRCVVAVTLEQHPHPTFTNNTSILQDSNGFNMEDLVNSELGNIWTEDSPPGDLGTFSMSGLNVQQQQQQQQIQHQLQPHLDQDSGHQKQKLKVIKS